MYEMRKPAFPRLHKCHHCKKRLNEGMDIVGKIIWWGDGCTYDWYCSKDCAKAEVMEEKARRERDDKLSREIEGRDDG